MITALAKKLGRQGLRACVSDKTGYLRWHPAWNNNPHMCHPNEAETLFATEDEDTLVLRTLKNHSGARHYIDWAASTPDRWTFKQWDIEPGEIYWSDQERLAVSQNKLIKKERNLKISTKILLDSGVKAGRQNKMWPLDNWNRLVMLLNEDNIDINNPLQTPDLRSWLVSLTRYSLIICHEGGLHHAAAALGIPCIVLFGGFISPSITGYNLSTARNLTHAEEFCGMIRPCTHCREEMEKIKPEEVMEHVKDLLRA